MDKRKNWLERLRVILWIDMGLRWLGRFFDVRDTLGLVDPTWRWVLFGGSLVLTSLVAFLASLPPFYAAVVVLGGSFMLIGLGIALISRIKGPASAASRRGRIVPIPQEQPPAPAVAPTLEELGVLYNGWANPAYESGDRILEQLCHSLTVPYVPGAEHRPTAEHHLAGLVNNCIREGGRRMQVPFTNALQRIPGSGFEDDRQVQEMFGEWYRAYLCIRYWIRTLAELAHVNLTEMIGYARWRNHDREFFPRLRELTAHERFSVLRQQVQGAGWGDDAPLPG